MTSIDDPFALAVIIVLLLYAIGLIFVLIWEFIEQERISHVLSRLADEIKATRGEELWLVVLIWTFVPFFMPYIVIFGNLYRGVKALVTLVVKLCNRRR